MIFLDLSLINAKTCKTGQAEILKNVACIHVIIFALKSYSDNEHYSTLALCDEIFVKYLSPHI